MTDMTRAFAPFDEREIQNIDEQSPPPRGDWSPILPVPEGAPELTNAVLRSFAPAGYALTTGWRYRDADGRLLGCAVRYDRPANGLPADKQVLPLAFCEGPDDRRQWKLKAFAGPRPLYGLDRLASRPNASVLVVEGEKTADAAEKRFPEMVAVTSPGGSKAAAKANWGVLRGREVTIWPDVDEPGAAYAEDVARLSTAAGAKTVRVVSLPQSFPKGWDLADDLPPGSAERDLKELIDRATRPGAGDGPLPLYPDLPDAEPFPIGHLGGILSRAAAAIASKIQVPEAIAAQSVLAAASLVAQAHADVLLPYGQSRPLSLYMVTIAGSGDRKSTADNEALWPIRKYEKTLKDQYDAELKDWLIDAAAWSAQKKKIEGDKKLDLFGQKDQLRALGAEPQRPLFPFITAPDPTIEGLAKAWVSAPAALGIFTAEGGQFVGGHGMGQDNRLKTAASFSEIWDGRPIKRVRAGDGVSILHGRRLALHLMVQPEAAAGFLADNLLRDQGLLSRVLVVAPVSISGTRLYRTVRPEDDAAIRAYGARLLSILETPWPLDDGKVNELVPRELAFDPEAETMWREFYDHVEGQCGKGKGLAPIQDLAAKIAEHAGRIAGVLTIMDDVKATSIGADAMENALVLSDWYLKEALRLQQAARTDPRLLKASVLLEWMRAQGKVVSFREILQFGPSANRSKASAEDAVAVLVNHGWLEEVSKRPRRFKVVSEEAA